MIEDFKLTDHFSFFEMTKTSHRDLQELNRKVSNEQVEKLTQVARLLEHVRYILETPLIVTSGYRCLDLNRRIGSNDTSQHLKCEAADFIPGKMDIGSAFRLIWRDCKDKGANIGQLIHENVNGKVWLHISLGTPYRKEEDSKQILRLSNGFMERLA